MFLIYVNDLVELLNNYSITVKLFADDVKLYIRVGTPNDMVELQKALSAFVSWVEKWQLSVSRCCVLQIKATPQLSFSLITCHCLLFPLVETWDAV